MNSGHSRRICVWAISSVCVKYSLRWQSWMKYRISCDTFVVRSVEFPELFRITPYFSLGGSSNVVDVTHTGLSGAVPRFLSFSQFIACIDFVAHNIVQFQSQRKWVRNESVDKDYPQKMILEIHYCNHQYPLRISSQNIVFVPWELSRASKNRYVFALCQFPVATYSVNFMERPRARHVTWNTFIGVSTCAPRGPHL